MNCAFRLPPALFHAIKQQAEAAGYDRSGGHSHYVERLLGRAVQRLSSRRRRTKTPAPKPADRTGNRTFNFELSGSLLQLYRLLAVQLGYKRYSDLIRETLADEIKRSR